ncbi:MAG: N-acetylglucosamine-6-phosphate deacetylase [Pseudorhodoplanes sp.]|nr:N-acetylglucosamine-6-phosphate deacetylase [Pseudorhodoplanes sp.]
MRTPNHYAVAADYVFDGSVVHRDTAIVIGGSNIVAVTPRADVGAATSMHALPDGLWLAPGFIDVQVNGGGDVLFNDAPTAEGIRAIAAAHRRFGTTAILPTLISDSLEKMGDALAAVQAAVTDESGVLGIHLEGPFLSPEKPGVHDPRHFRKPTVEDDALILAPRPGVTVVTLAPEQVPEGFVRQLAQAGIRVSLGHSMATYAQTQAAIAEGLTGFTHLFNAMRPLGSREPGPIAAALESSGAFFGMIVDGVHVDPAMLRLALRGAAQPMLVTDAMPPVGGQRTTFMLYGDEITVWNGRCLRSDGTLAGAALTMADAIRNCVEQLGVSLETALRFASANPARFLGLDNMLGRLAPGYRADIVAFAPGTMEVVETWVAGQDQHSDVIAREDRRVGKGA